jgi:5-formyltetrahydrofolate cyclo-ligase
MSIPLNTKNRSAWRAECRLRAQALGTKKRADAAQVFSMKLLALIESFNVQTIAMYWPIHDEPDLSDLCKQLWRTNRLVALPIVVAPAEPLKFALWQASDDLVVNRWGIAEPSQQAATLPLAQIDMIIMPCVGFWQTGHRLGYGGGFYDRTVALWRNETNNSQKRFGIVGVAYSECELPDLLPLLPTDQACDAVITPVATLYGR